MRPAPAAVAAPRTTGAARSRAWRAVACAMFACGWGGNQFTPLLLMYRERGGYSVLDVDAFLGAYVLGLVPGLLLSGPASDRYGRRPLLLAGTAASALASVVLACGVTGPWPLYAGRLLTGLAVGSAMAVGSSWVKELSGAGTAGARRASLWLTAGFGVGAGVAGTLAQWGPWPMVLPYLVHVLLTLPLLVLLPRVPETGGRAAPRSAGLLRGLLGDLRVPPAGRRRFRRTVLPMAPWVFAASALAYAVMPQLVADRVGSFQSAYATALTVLTLGTGAAVQPVAKRVMQRSPRRAAVTAMSGMTVGAALCALDAVLRSPWLALPGAAVLGAAYGIAVVTGLQEVQSLAAADALAGLTGVYYALAYSGFLLPAVLAALGTWFPCAALLTTVTLLAAACLIAVATGGSPRPAREVARGAGCPVPRAGDRSPAR